MWQFTFGYFKRLDVDHCLCTTILGMKMRRGMFVPIHF